ncbi:MAG: Fic family protein [Deltaproteobacteria bacterium]|nr:Fic family protein [Deltaproteobacteria bacterium]
MPPVSYHLSRFPPTKLDWSQLIPRIGPASAAVARYDGVLAAIPNTAVLLAPLTTQEAVLSSRIEGTQATMGEVMRFEAAGNRKGATDDGKVADIQEVLNYRRALRLAEERLRTLPLSRRLLCEVHGVLLDGARGRGRQPGALRQIPNWIGPAGCTIEQARFVPVGADRLADVFTAWERYVHADAPDRLVQVALAHAEFEAMHPFLDGNGRLGRMIVPLMLWQHGLIRAPMFYISAYFEAKRDVYYERLLAVSRDDDWTGWCGFFLDAARSQAEANLERATAILGLYDALKSAVVDWTRSQYAVGALDWIFGRPIFSSTDFIADAQVPSATARRLLGVFREHGMVVEIEPPRGRRAAICALPRLLNIAEGREVF